MDCSGRFGGAELHRAYYLAALGGSPGGSKERFFGTLISVRRTRGALSSEELPPLREFGRDEDVMHVGRPPYVSTNFSDHLNFPNASTLKSRWFWLIFHLPSSRVMTNRQYRAT
jgi:hypothetical protein